MKTAFIHGIVNPHDHSCSAFVIEDNKFIYTGNDETAVQMADHIIDLNGKCVLPGFNDSHMHLLNIGNFLCNLDLTHATSVQQMKELAAKHAEQIPSGNWVTGRGFNQDNFTDGKMITRKDLDEACPNHPAVMTRCCGHTMVVNTKALEAAGITEQTTIEGGSIDYEHGWLAENANELIKAAQSKITIEQIEQMLIKAAEYCNTYGITSVQSDDFMTLTHHYDKVLEAMIRLDQKKQLTVRICEQCQFLNLEIFQQFLDDPRRQIQSHFLKMGPLKMLQDGSLGARTAALSAPYHDDPSTSGMIVIPQHTLEDFLSLAKKYNLGAAVHVIGDQACETVLNAYEKINDPGNPLRSGLVHVQITRFDQLERIAKLNLHNYIQTIFVDYDARIVKDRVGALEKSSYAFKTLHDTCTISNGSDAPVELPDVMKGIECAVTRTSITNPDCHLNKKEALTLTQAINSYTVNGAYASFEEDIKGKIECGYLADFVVLEKNPYEVNAEDLHKIQICETWINGINVYQK